MNLKPINKNLLIVYTFGTTKPKNVESPVLYLGIFLNNGFTMILQMLCLIWKEARK